MNSINISSIIRPDNTLSMLLSMLMPTYIRDYGKDNKFIIKDRLRKAAFIFDSDPIATEKFMKEHMEEIDGFSYLRRSAREYKDYINQFNKLDKEINGMLESFLQYRYSRETLNKDIRVLDLDFESYSLKNTQLLYCCDDKQKEVIEQRRHNYKLDCLKIGLEPVTNYKHIDEIMNYKKALIDFRNYELFNNTKWGKRIRRELYTKYGFEANENDLCDIIYDENPATTAVIKDKDGVSHTIVYIPLMKNSDYANLDRILYHELRHVVESTDHSCGIYDFNLGKYDLINEIRTEKHAMEDERFFDDIVFFAKGASSKRSIYELFALSCEDFLENYHDLFDSLAFSGEVEALDTLIGEDYLEKIESQLCDGIIVNKSIQKVKTRQ